MLVSEISIFVFSIKSIPKKSGIKKQMKYFLLWRGKKFFENFFHLRSILFILMIPLLIFLIILFLKRK